jgi:hypothetical protein
MRRDELTAFGEPSGDTELPVLWPIAAVYEQGTAIATGGC